MLDLQAELHEVGQTFQDLYEAVAELKRRYDLHPCSVRPWDVLALRSESDREAVQELVAQFRRLPEETRRRLPALWNSLGQLQVVVGDLSAAANDFEEVARQVQDPTARAEVHHNLFRTALERQDWEAALIALRRAVVLDPEVFEPFPFSRYEPKRILGAGGFGMSVLCQDRISEHQVFLKVLRGDSLDRDAESLAKEIQILHELDHPSVAQIIDLGRMGSEASGWGRRYLVQEQCEGELLDQLIARQGPLSAEVFFDIAWAIARALQALHNRGILYRCLRPRSILVNCNQGSDGNPVWTVKLLDIGLCLRRAVLHSCASHPESLRGTTLGRSVAATLAFLSPEVLGRPKGQVWIGPHSDFYSFGRIAAFALTGKPEPDPKEMLALPEIWQQLIEECTAWTINRRPSHAGILIDRLAHLPGAEQRSQFLERHFYEACVSELSKRLQSDSSNPDYFIRRASAYARQGEAELALADYTEAISYRPDEPELYRRRANILVRSNRPAEAVSDYSKALQLQPRHHMTVFSRGMALVASGKYAEAIADFSEAIRLQPKDVAAYYHRGNAYYLLGQFHSAIDDYTAAIRIDSRYLWALGNRGKCYSVIGEPARAIADFTRFLQLDPSNVRALCDRAAVHVELNRVEQALADYSHALQHERSVDILQMRGLTLFHHGRVQDAIADFSEALEIAPDNVGLLILRGRAYGESAQIEDGLADFARALELSQHSALILKERAAFFIRTGKIQEALGDLDRAIEHNPGEKILYFQRGNIHSEMDNQELALADFTRVIELDKQAAAAYLNRGNSYARLGDLERAIADYTESLRLEPNTLLTYLNRAGTFLQAGRIEEAIADYSEVIRLDPAHVRAYLCRGNLLITRGQLDAALVDLDQAIRLDPTNAQALNLRGSLHAMAGKSAKALADFGEAIRINPEFVSPWYNRGMCHLEQLQLDDARANFERVLQLQPSHVWALVNRGTIRRRQGDSDGALADFTQAVELDPNTTIAFYNRALINLERKNYESALADLDTVIDTTPDDVTALLCRAKTYSEMGRYSAALIDNTTAHRQAPNDPRTLNNLAWLLATAPDNTVRDVVRALELAQQSITLGEDITRMDTLAAALAANDCYEEAIQLQERVVELAPESEREEYSLRLELYRRGMPFYQSRSVPDGTT